MKKIMKKKFILVFFALFHNLVLSADWQKIANSNDGTSVFIDNQSIKRSYGSLRQAWVRFDKPRKDYYRNLPYNVSLDLQEVNCSNGQMRSLQTAFYYNGDLITSSTLTSHWNAFVPDTLGDAIFNAICKGASSYSQHSYNLNSYSVSNNGVKLPYNTNIRTCGNANCSSLGVMPNNSYIFPLLNNGKYIFAGKWVAVQYSGEFCYSDTDISCSSRTSAKTVRGFVNMKTLSLP